MSTISASTTSTTAFKVTSDTTGTLVFQTGAVPTTAISIDASQAVGIGTSSPGARLEVTGNILQTWAASHNRFIGTQFSTTYENGLRFLEATRETQVIAKAADTGGLITFFTGITPSERMRLDGSGNLGIGTSSPSDILTLAGGASGSYGLTINNAKVGGGTKAIFQYDATNAIALVGGNTTNGLAFQTLTGGSLTTKATIDSSGNLGLGVTPRAWAGGYKSFDITGPGAIASTASGDTFTQVANGAWFNGTNWIYQYTGVGAARYQMTGPSGGGNHSWHVAATGTAGNTVSFTQAMTLTAAGVLCVGATSNTSRGGGNATLLTYKPSGTNYVDIQCGSSGDSGLLFSTGSSGNYGLINYSHSVSAMLFYTASVERMRINSSGNVGISEGNSPTQVLSLYRSGSTNAIMSAGNSNTGLDGTWFGVDTGGNGIVNVRGAFPLIFSTSALERMRITSDGKVGIASTNPGVDLQIGSDTSTTRALSVRYSSVPLYLSGGFDGTNALNTFSANAYANATGSGQSWTSFSNTSYAASAVQLASSTTGADIRFLTAAAANTNPTERARITSGGDLLVGTTSNYSARMSLAWDSSVQSGIILRTTSATLSGNPVIFQDNGGVARGSISQTASAVAYNTSSDYRLKNTIAPMTGALAKVALLKPCTYKWNADGSDGQGFIAHELAEVVPQCVTGEKDAVDAEGKPQYQGVDTSFLVATLTAAIQELTARVAQLESK